MRTRRMLTVAAAGVLSTCILARAAEEAAPVVARPFALSRVALLDGPFQKAMAVNRAYLLSLDADRFLWPFHERAGLPTKGERYGGWEKLDVVGHMSGHYLSACAMTYAATGDAELKRRVDYMVAEIAKVQAKHGDGYAGSVRPEVWKTTFAGQIKVHKWGLGGGYVPWYVLHKTYAGLIDACEHAGNKQALEVARKFADWAKKGTDNLTDEQFQKMLACEYGGMNESLANLYGLTGDKELRFRTQNVGQPADVALIPLHQLHHQRYTVYWKLLTQGQWLKEKADREAEDRRRKELEARTVDFVTSDAPLERAHNQQGKGSNSGAAFGRRWRDARGGGWFSYDMKVVPDRPVSLVVTYWGGDVGNRSFDILVDGQKVGTQKLNAPKPGAFMDVTYPVPANLTKGKRKVTVKFQAHPGSMAGGAFGCRIILLSPQSDRT